MYFFKDFHLYKKICSCGAFLIKIEQYFQFFVIKIKRNMHFLKICIYIKKMFCKAIPFSYFWESNFVLFFENVILTKFLYFTAIFTYFFMMFLLILVLFQFLVNDFIGICNTFQTEKTKQGGKKLLATRKNTLSKHLKIFL